MLLNYFAQPTVLAHDKVLLNIQEFKQSPLLLCHKNALDGKIIPTDWSGILYGTEAILSGIKQKNYKIKPTSIQALCPNEIYNICRNIDESQCKVKNIELTAIPWDGEIIMYLIKANNVINLLTDALTEDMDVFVHNKILRNIIKSGVDVLYVNDAVYQESSQLSIYPSECLLGALVTLVQPRSVQGLYGEQLPLHILNCCRYVDVSCGY